MKEQRKHPRRVLRSDLTIFMKDPTAFLTQQSMFPADLLNISEGGLSFKTTHPDVEVGHPIAIEVFKTDDMPSFSVNARIVSVQIRSIGNEHYSVVGVVFSEVSQQVQGKIRSYVADAA